MHYWVTASSVFMIRVFLPPHRVEIGNTRYPLHYINQFSFNRFKTVASQNWSYWTMKVFFATLCLYLMLYSMISFPIPYYSHGQFYYHIILIDPENSVAMVLTQFSYPFRGPMLCRIILRLISRISTEVGAESPVQALTLLSEDGPNFISRALSETLPRSLGVQDFLRRPP